MKKEQKKEFISVIIPVYNGEKIIDNCLTALCNQSILRSNYEILVVDDGSTDDTATKAENKCDKLIRIRNSGPAVARNKGAEAASGQILLFTDADCIPESDWIARMSLPFKEKSIAGTKGSYLTRQTQAISRFVQAEYESKYTFMSTHRFIDFIDTYSAGFRTDVFRELGGFDERFPGASVEDQEFSFRVAAAGYKMVFVPEAKVFHHHVESIRHYFQKKMNIGYWKTLVLRIHPEKIIKDTHTPQTLKLQLPLSFLLILFFVLFPFTGYLPLIFTFLVFLFAGRRETIQCISNKYWLSATLSPVFMWVRSIALALGLIKGFILSPAKKLDLT